MWKRRIIKCDLGWKVYREKEINDYRIVHWLQHDTYTLNRDFAKIFFNKDDALSALIIARFKWEKIPIHLRS